MATEGRVVVGVGVRIQEQVNPVLAPHTSFRSIQCVKQTFLTLAEVEVIGNLGDVPKRVPVSSVVCGNSVTGWTTLSGVTGIACRL